MAYTKHTWTTGEVITAGRLNNMEDGIAGAGEVMVINDTDGTLDKTWQEIYDAVAQGKLCVVKKDDSAIEGGISTDIVNVVSPSGYMVGAGDSMYRASSATGYPATSGGS